MEVEPASRRSTGGWGSIVAMVGTQPIKRGPRTASKMRWRKGLVLPALSEAEGPVLPAPRPLAQVACPKAYQAGVPRRAGKYRGRLARPVPDPTGSRDGRPGNQAEASILFSEEG